MSNYTKSTNFTAKDSLPTGDTNKVIRGSEFDIEFNAIATAVATKSDLAGPTFTGTATFDGITATGTVNFTGGSVTTNIDGGTIDGVTIGGTTAGAGTFSSLTATTADINAGTVDNTVIGGTTPAAGTFTAVAGTTGTFSGAVTGSNLNASNWDTAFGWGNHATQGYLTSVTFSNIDAGAVTTSSETFADSDTQIPTNAAVIDYVAATIPLITEVNDLSSVVTWADVPDANITQSSVTQHQSALSIAATQLTGNITVPGNVYLAPSGTGFTELRGNNNSGAIRFNCEVNTHGVTLKGPPHSASATYELELPDADGSAGQFLKTDGSGKLSFGTVDVSTKVDENHTGDVDITGELLVDSYNETFKKVSSVASYTGFQLASASYIQSFSVSSQDNIPLDVAFNGDGTKMFVVGNTNDKVYEYNLTTGFDISTASYSQDFSVTTQDTGPYGLTFNSDGTKMFILGGVTDAVYEYDLSTGFDISTASYSQNFSLTSQSSGMIGLGFNPDGTKMYTVDVTSDAVWQYNLSTGFDVSTASYIRNFSVAAQDTSPHDVTFNNDGTKMYVVGNVGDDIIEYTLTTGFEINTASYTQNLVVSAQDASPTAVKFNNDGTKMFVVGEAGDQILEYYTRTVASSIATFDCENANVFETVLDGNTTVVFSNPPAAGTATDSTAYAMSLKVVQDSGASGYTVTWPTSVDWPSATAPTLTATASAVDQFVFYTHDGGTTWYGFTAGQALG